MKKLCLSLHWKSYYCWFVSLIMLKSLDLLIMILVSSVKMQSSRYGFHLIYFISHIRLLSVFIVYFLLRKSDFPKEHQSDSLQPHRQYIYTVHGILQARILEWVAFPFSRGPSQPRDLMQVSCIAGGFFISRATREPNSFYLIFYISHIKFCLFLLYIFSSEKVIFPKNRTLE